MDEKLATGPSDMKGWQRDITFYLNGRKVVVYDAQPQMTLLTYIRSTGLTGSKLGCGEGGCGACTVMVSSWEAAEGKVVHNSVNACLAPVCSVDSCAVTTIEGIGSLKAGLHPLQKRVAEAHGSQCGFCTPGIIMAMYTLFRRNPKITAKEIEENMDGNLCRCTGYRPLLDAAKSLVLSGGGGCCKGNGGKGGCPCKEGDSGADVDVVDTTEGRCSDRVKYPLYDPTTEPIFPPALMLSKPRALYIQGKSVEWYKPTTLDALLTIKDREPSSRLVGGNTEVGIETKFKGIKVPILISPVAVPELAVIEVVPDKGVLIGGNVALARLEHWIEHAEEQGELPLWKIRSLTAIRYMLRWFASNQIRNVASVAGNIATASPISDLNPCLMALGATLNLVSLRGGARQVNIRDFFLAYRKVDLRPEEIIQSVLVPFTTEYEYVSPYKQAKRREDDISIVTSCLRIKLSPQGQNGGGSSCWKIEEAGLGFGGMAPTTVAARGTEAYLVGKPWSETTLEGAYTTLLKDMPLPPNVPGGQVEFRLALPPSFLFKFFVQTSLTLAELAASNTSLPSAPVIAAADRSAARSFVTEPKPETRGEQHYTINKLGGMNRAHPTPHTPEENQKEVPRGTVGQPLMHKSAYVQCSGEAKYTDDIAEPPGTLHAALVMSTKAHARILSVDPSKALALEGVVQYFDHKDVKGSNMIGAVVKDEEVSTLSSNERHLVG